jgi:hypothetical protein
MSERMQGDAPGAGLDALLRGGRAEAFAPGFAHRVMRRVRDEQAPGAMFTAVLQRQFLRLAPLAAAAVLVLAGWNLRASDAGQTPVEAALGLPAVTLDAVWSVDAPAAAPATGRERG